MMKMKVMALVVALAGVALVAACGGVEPNPTQMVQAPESALLYARGAVEVGRIDISQMGDFEAAVQRMDGAQRSALWAQLTELHAKVHSSTASTSSALMAPGCSPNRCSHSVGCLAQWCCAFGEDATYYGPGGCPE